LLNAHDDGFLGMLNCRMRGRWQIHAQAKTRDDVDADEHKKHKQEHHHIDHGDQLDASFVPLGCFNAVEHGFFDLWLLLLSKIESIYFKKMNGSLFSKNSFF